MKTLRTDARLSAHVLPGKQALQAEHRALLDESLSARVASSVDFEALASQHRRHKRVDYLIESNRCPSRSHAIEIHAFEARTLIEKKRGTVALLDLICPGASAEIESWQVILRGASPRSDVKARFEAETRIQIAGRHLRIATLPCRTP